MTREQTKTATAATDASPESDIEVARRVLRLEAEGLDALSAALDDAFVHAVDTLAGVRGRVIISGMGKSGHIARKIAATMASTGTPAMFVHPGEASHGDLGMITTDDAVLILSNSGKTPELADIVAYTRRHAIPLIAIVGRSPSPLGDAADITLVLPPTPEACPMGLAPTTSTTVTLALGDALAVALLERLGFSSDQFQDLHPGGHLGSSLTRISDIMHSGDAVPLTGPEALMSEVLIVMSSKSFGCVGVVEDGVLAGVITDGDLRRHMSDEFLTKTAADVMTPGPQTIRPEALAAEAVGRMSSGNITSLFVVEAQGAGQIVGIVHLHDCLRAGVA